MAILIIYYKVTGIDVGLENLFTMYNENIMHL